MEKKEKISRKIPWLYLVMTVLTLSVIKPETAYASENSGGFQTVSYNFDFIRESGTGTGNITRRIYDDVITLNTSSIEIIGVLYKSETTGNSGQTIGWTSLRLLAVSATNKTQLFSALSPNSLSFYSHRFKHYLNGSLIKTEEDQLSDYLDSGNVISLIIDIPISALTPGVSVSSSVSGVTKIFDTYASALEYAKTGSENGLVKLPEQDSKLYINGLNAYLNQEHTGEGGKMEVSWNASTIPDYPSSDLTVECKVNFTMTDKFTREKTVVLDYDYRSGVSAVPDSDKGFSFSIYGLMSAYCDQHNIDDTPLIMQIDGVYCRYLSKSTKNFGPWQKTGSGNPGDHGDTEESLNFQNFKAKTDTSTTPYSYTATWDVLDNYDDNTFLIVNADINWKYTPRDTNSVSYVPIVEVGTYKANTGSFSIYVPDVWKGYFAENNINSGALETKWTSRLYYQVVKYDEETQSYIKSDIRYFDPASPSTGQSYPQAETGNGKFDPETGDFIKDKDTVTNTDGFTGETIQKPNDIFGDDLELPENTSVLDYFETLFKAFASGINGLLTGVGRIPQFIATVFNFLPNEIITIIGIGFIIAIILRILGR